MHRSFINRACIVVLGDIGRSPRMQYHAKSLIEENYLVDIIGYEETKILDSLTEANTQCKIHKLTQFPEIYLAKTLKYIFKTFWQTLSLLIALISIQRPNFILIQNPPAVPTFLVCWFYCILTRTKFIIDWHNYTHTILSLESTNKKSLIIQLAKWIEYRFGKKASANFCVTKAMQTDLKENWGIDATVLYDRPAVQFKQITLEDKHELFMKLSKEYEAFLPTDINLVSSSDVIESTALTQKHKDGTITLKLSRPAVLVSSTSWTPDEDFGILLKALQEYETVALKSTTTYPNLLCIITGKGPLKDFYLKKIEDFEWNKVKIITPWLESADYPKILASADLGVCLHWSSSGLDLPMKVVDMFGCGLPVCAINFNCLNELVVHGENGFVFDNSNELSEQLLMWFETFPKNLSLLNTKEKFTKNLKKFQSLNWKDNWKTNALKVFDSFT